MTDPIADMLNRIRNAQAVSHQTVNIPFSNLKYEIAEVLKKHGFVEKVEKKGKKINKTIEIILKYDGKTPVISGLKRISKPGQRIYKGSKELRRVRGGYGIAIISTPKGLMTNKEARRRKIGGEVLAEIW
ncbi:30S ribosomal protein S8 [Patescibacteria group bacterium]|nr:30S ribosomal protein S8 [Patescibacteria group bacterium]